MGSDGGGIDGAWLAQRTEHQTHNLAVTGSTPVLLRQTANLPPTTKPEGDGCPLGRPTTADGFRRQAVSQSGLRVGLGTNLVAASVSCGKREARPVSKVGETVFTRVSLETSGPSEERAGELT